MRSSLALALLSLTLITALPPGAFYAAAASTAEQGPVITSVSPIRPWVNQTIVIVGAGFGVDPELKPASGGGFDTIASSTHPWLVIQDLGSGKDSWLAGVANPPSSAGTSIGVYVRSWNNTEIVLEGFGSGPGGLGNATSPNSFMISDGDVISIRVHGPNDSGRAVYQVTVSPTAQKVTAVNVSALIENMTMQIPPSSLVTSIEKQLESYYNPAMGGFRCFPPSLGQNTDNYDYWADDTGKILTAASVVHDYEMAEQAFDFLYGIRAYGYMMPARIVQVRVHPLTDGAYGNEIVAAGGSPLGFGTDLFGFNEVANITSVNGEPTSGYTVTSGSDKYVMHVGTSNVTLSTQDYLEVSAGQPSSAQFYVGRIHPLEVKAFSSSLELVGQVMGDGSLGPSAGVIVYDPDEGVINGIGGFVLSGNITSVTVSWPYVTVHFNGPLRIYPFDSTFDPNAANYVAYGVVRGLYRPNSDISTPASFGYILLGSTLYGLQTKNSTVIDFARSFLNFWFPIVEADVADDNFYPRSLSTFFMGALLLEPSNLTLLSAAENYASLYPQIKTEPIDSPTIGLTAGLIALLERFGYNGTAEMRAYEAQEQSWEETVPTPSFMTTGYKLGEGLMGWMWAGQPYNSSLVKGLVNDIDSYVLSSAGNGYAITSDANTEGVPAVLEAMALWQTREYQQTGRVTNGFQESVSGTIIVTVYAVVVVAVLVGLSVFMLLHRRHKPEAPSNGQSV